MAWPAALPGVTGALIVVTVLVHLVDVVTGGALHAFGAKTVAIWDGEVYRLITPALLHADFIHLLVNMYALYLFGRTVEGLIGPRRFLALYVVSSVCGVALSLLVLPDVPAVGASAAIFGLMGYILHYRLRRVPLRWLPFDNLVGQILVLNLLLGFVVPNIDQAAHLGGLVGGAVTGSLVGLHRRGERRLEGTREPAVAALGLGLFAWVALNPLVLAVGLDRVQADWAETIASRYAPYSLAVEVDGPVIVWRGAGLPVRWMPVQSATRLPRSEDIQMAVHWIGPSGRGPGSELFWVRWLQDGQLVREARAWTTRAGSGQVRVRSSLSPQPAQQLEGSWSLVLFRGRSPLFRAIWEVMPGGDVI